MERITEMEAVAIKEARRSLALALIARGGLDAPFSQKSGEEIDQIIWAVITGFRSSMQQQSIKGEIPY